MKARYLAQAPSAEREQPEKMVHVIQLANVQWPPTSPQLGHLPPARLGETLNTPLSWCSFIALRHFRDWLIQVAKPSLPLPQARTCQGERWKKERSIVVTPKGQLSDLRGHTADPGPGAGRDSPHETDQPELGPAIRVERLGRQHACDCVHTR